MEMNIFALSEKLKRHNPEIYINQPELTTIQDVEIYEENQSFFVPYILYILKLSDFPVSELKAANDCIFCILNNNTVPEVFVEYANGNYLILNDSIDIVSIYEEIHTILEEYAQHMKNIATLNNLLFEKKGLQEIMNTGHEILGNPLVLEDPLSNLIIYTETAKSEDAISNSIVNGYNGISNSNYGNYDIKREYEKIPANDAPVYLKSTEKFTRLVANVVIDNKIIARLSIIESERSFKENDFELVSLLSKIISYEMQKDKFNCNSKGLPHEYLILDLIEGRMQNPLLIAEKIKKCKWNLKENLYILTIAGNSNDRPVRTISNIIRDALQNTICGSKSIIYNGYIVLVITRSKEIPLSEEEFANLKNFFESNNLCGGLSRCFNHLKDINQYYLQSLKAIELGRRMNKEKTFFYYEDYAVFHMLDICSRQENLKNFCHPSLLLLLEYDRLNNTCYTFSIFVYLKYKGNHKDTADKLCISPSTLVYRISRIKSIIQDDLNNEDFIFQLLLSFKILEYTGEFQLINESNISSN